MNMRSGKKLVIFVAGFLFSLSMAFTTYINSSFLTEYVDRLTLGIIYTAASLVSILIMFRMPRLLNRFGARRFSLYASILASGTFFILALTPHKALAIGAFIANTVAINFLIASLDIFVEDFSKNHNIGRFRGLYLSIINIAWVLSQVLSGSIITKSSFSGIYMLSALFMILTTFIFSFFLHEFKDPKYIQTPVLRIIRNFIKNHDIGRIYLLNFILKFFFAWMGIYTPLYLNQVIGFGWDKIGLIFAIMLTPFVFLSYPLGRLSDKYGEKSFLIFGFLCASITVFMIPQIKAPLFIYWAGILFLSRIGAATIEVMTESYFFKVESEENADAISFFRNTHPLSYLIAPILASAVLFFTPGFQYIFIALTIVMLIGLYISLRLRDIK
ncbi:MAG: MFS transporter [Candidatus Paceibacterota bacterium]